MDIAGLLECERDIHGIASTVQVYKTNHSNSSKVASMLYVSAGVVIGKFWFQLLTEGLVARSGGDMPAT